jgi:hypothetical protein
MNADLADVKTDFKTLACFDPFVPTSIQSLLVI